MNEVTGPGGYGTGTHSWRRSGQVVTTVTDGGVVAAAVVVSLAVRTGSVAAGVVLGLAAAVVVRSPPLAIVIVVLASAGAVRSQHEWADLAPDVLGAFDGWVRLVDDPQPYRSSTRVIVEVEGERFELWSRGRRPAAAGALVEGWRVGLGEW